jgi:hypothetical protein
MILLMTLTPQAREGVRSFKGAEIANGSLVHRGYVFIVFVINAVQLRQHPQKPVRVT